MAKSTVKEDQLPNLSEEIIGELSKVVDDMDSPSADVNKSEFAQKLSKDDMLNSDGDANEMDLSGDQSRLERRSDASVGSTMRETQNEMSNKLNAIKNIKVAVQVILGGFSMSVAQLSNLKPSELVSLDTKIGESLDILANGQLIARGEIVVIEEESPKFGITLTEIIS